MTRAPSQAEHAELTQWRRMLHAQPELMFDVHETAQFAAARLRDFGCDEVVTGIGKTGVVGLIHGKRGPGKTVGLRADMDALPIEEQTNLPYASKVLGKMHACGHDGHTTMLLGAARILCQTRDFAGTVALIFQPAEEAGDGGRIMVEEGVMERFNISSVYGLHNEPGKPVGHFGIRAGGIMAASDVVTITVTGKGGHSSTPELCIDPVLVGAEIITSIQSIVARNTDPLEPLVISLCTFHAGEAPNVVPQQAVITGTVRSFSTAMQDFAERRIREVSSGIAKAHGAEAEVKYERLCPPTINHGAETDVCIRAARAVAGDAMVDGNIKPIMGSEDFSFMLQARPGAYIMLGQGDTAYCHHPAYDFNDAIIPAGVAYWVKLAEIALET
jgi:hippurate hydrolase